MFTRQHAKFQWKVVKNFTIEGSFQNRWKILSNFLHQLSWIDPKFCSPHKELRRSPSIGGHFSRKAASEMRIFAQKPWKNFQISLQHKFFFRFLAKIRKWPRAYLCKCTRIERQSSRISCEVIRFESFSTLSWCQIWNLIFT